LRLNSEVKRIGKTTGNPFAERLFADRRPCVFVPDPVSLQASRA
jgi:hypothetical protein